MQSGSDKNFEGFPVDGSSALEAVSSAAPSGRKKKSRRKNKKNAVTYALALETETQEPEVNGVIKTDEDTSEGTVENISAQEEKKQEISPAEPDKAEPEISPEIKKPTVSSAKEVFGGSVRTDVQLEKEDPSAVPDGSGIVYEVAEELYRREKTQAELEALCHPPFTKVFTEKQKVTLDREAEERTRRLVSAAAEAQAKEPAFLPDGLYEESDKPISTATAFLLEFVMLIPILNVIAAIIYSFMGKTNKNIRAFSRGFLIWSVLTMLAVSAYLAVYFINSQIQTGNTELLEVFNLFQL